MGILDHITTPDEYAAVACIFRETTVRGFDWAIEQLFRNGGGVSTPADLRHFGELAEEIRRTCASEELQGGRLQKLAASIARQLGVRESNDTHPDKPLVNALFELGARREHRRQDYHVAESNDIWAFCATIDVALLALAMGIAPEEIAESPQSLAELIHRYTSDIGRPVKAGQARAILRDIARWGAVSDWVSPEAVELVRARLRRKPPAVTYITNGARIVN
jgi:hypothetical protein